MIGNVLKITVTLALGYALGWIAGSTLGFVVGAVPALFFREIVDSNLAIVMSISTSLLLGAILGFLATQISNRLFAASDKPWTAVMIGMVIGLIVLFFVDGILSFSDSATLDQSATMLPLIYAGMVGSDIGSIIFPIVGATRVIRDIMETHKEARKNQKRLEEIQISLGIHAPQEGKRG